MKVQPLSGNYALLKIGNVRMAFSQKDVQVIGLSSDVQYDLQTGHDCGSLVNKDGKWPVYSLTDSLQPLLQLSKNRKFCVCFGPGNGDRAYALGCDSVESLTIDDDVNIQPLPECMTSPDMPLRQLMLDEDQLIFLGAAADMHDYLNGWEK